DRVEIGEGGGSLRWLGLALDLEPADAEPTRAWTNRRDARRTNAGDPSHALHVLAHERGARRRGRKLLRRKRGEEGIEIRWIEPEIRVLQVDHTAHGERCTDH